MKMLLTILFLFFCLMARGQNPIANFSMLNNGCIDQNIFFQNQSTNTLRYEWDLCQGDLSLTPSGSKAGIVTGSNVPTGFDVVFDGTSWYGFVASRDNNSIIRISLGADLNSYGSVTNLGNISSLLSQPIDIKIVSDNNKWYGFVYNQSGNVLICRLDFGSSLTNVPTASPILNGSTQTDNQGLDVIRDNTTWFVAYTINSQVGILRLPTIETIPDISNQLLTSNLTYQPNLGDLKIIGDKGNSFYIYTISWAPQALYKLTFGSTLFNQPVESHFVSPLLSSSFNYYGIDGGYDEGVFHLFLATLQGSLFRIDLDANLLPTSTQVLSLGIFTNTIKNRLVKHKSNWFVFSVDYGSGNFYRAYFSNPSNCEFPTIISDKNPQITFSKSGTKYITLTAFSSSGAYDESTGGIIISSLISPDIALNSTNNCSKNNVYFNSTNQSGNITNYQLDFNDGTTSNSPNPSHIYTNAATYYPNLTVTASNGCQNFVQRTLQIFNPPQANFTLPLASPFCSNQTYQYTNTSTFDVGSNTTWQWNVNGSNVSTTQNLNYLFTSSAAQNVTLTASIPGCSTQSTQNITTLVDGPLIRFSAPTIGCKGASISFNNTTTDPVNTFSWSFGDGHLSSQNSASNVYSSPGSYQATLTGTNANGCQNSFSQNITVYSVPQPNFTIEAPPLSCEKTPAQFDNLTQPLADSNISSWAWKFGDANQGSSSVKNPTYTYSSANNYVVSLRATTNVGCKDSIQKLITILPSPQAGFINSAACINQSTQFTDASTGSISLYQWNVQNMVLSGTSPSYVFKSSGIFPVTLTTTGSNGCLNQSTKNIQVPIMPVIAFTVQAPCTGHPTIFQELNSGGPDPTVSWNWDFGLSSSTGSPVSYQFPSQGIYSVTMNTTRQSGCVYSTQKNIVISSGPIARFTPSVFAGAAPLDVIFKNASTADSYLWQFGDAVPTTSTVGSPEFIYTQLGKYKVLLTAFNALGCSDTLSTEIDVVIPHIDIVMNNLSLTNDPNTNSSNAIVTLLNSGNIPLMDPEVLIDFGGSASVKEKISGLLRPGKTIIQTLGLQIIPRSLEYICAEIDVANDVDIHNNKQCVALLDEDVVLTPYPNPSTSGGVTLEWVEAAQEDVVITIFKSDGAVAFEKHLDKSSAGLGQLTINTSSFANGLYLIQFAGRKTTKTFRVVIAN